ncbi:hypothetical protein HK100_001790 [Physocladia obscura]|uniref:Uncharacterized protein n=1 Tax=Physocladia obscura TaxID=109957 RepID=A0AAD5TBH9_9FUNG|nr:hypothetical protein HK100_001790 [Physocladia obscura]
MDNERCQSSYLNASCTDDRGSADGTSTIVGEFSLSVPDDLQFTAAWDPSTQRDFYEDWFAAQLYAYQKQLGWIFWSWKTQLGDYRWDYKAAVAAGVIPTDWNDLKGPCGGGDVVTLAESLSITNTISKTNQANSKTTVNSAIATTIFDFDTTFSKSLLNTATATGTATAIRNISAQITATISDRVTASDAILTNKLVDLAFVVILFVLS